MAIHYRSLTRAYREVPLEHLRKAVDVLERRFAQFRREEIEWNDLKTTWKQHAASWEWVSVSEVLSQDQDISRDAQDVVSRNEVLHEYMPFVELAAKGEKRKTPLRKEEETREEYLQRSWKNSCLENIMPPYPDLVPSLGGR